LYSAATIPLKEGERRESAEQALEGMDQEARAARRIGRSPSMR